MKVYTTLGDGIDRLELTERAEPKAKTNEVLVKMTAASLNYRDLLVINGTGGWKPATPRIPISDGVGEIIALGEKASPFKVDDRAAGIFLSRNAGDRKAENVRNLYPYERSGDDLLPAGKR